MKKRMLPDEGAALVTVLVMVAIMSALAIVVVDAGRFALARTSNQAQMEQAHLFLLGAESHALSRIALVDEVRESRIDQEEWQNRDFTYPLDGGVLTIRLRDGSNCFNLNSVVDQDEGGRLIASARGMVQFARLLDLLDIRATLGLAAALADYIDSDSEPLSGGGEDRAGGDPTYRTANTLIGDLSELNRVRGFTPEIVHALATQACVRPTSAPNQININTITEAQAPVLAMIVGGGFTISAAREAIRARPHGGWESTEEFFAQPRFGNFQFNDVAAAQFSTEAGYYVLSAHVKRGDMEEDSLALIAAGAEPYVIRRILGAGGWEHAL